MTGVNIAILVANVVIFAAFGYLTVHGVIDGPSGDGLEWKDFVSILLTTVAVMLAAVTALIAAAAIWGYTSIRDAAIRLGSEAATNAGKIAGAEAAKKPASEIAEKVARDVAEQVAALEARNILADAGLSEGDGLSGEIWKGDGDVDDSDKGVGAD